ncbi:hypothetical protein ELE36_20150 [Pseudolysobacter antarcticus]|uniref:ATP-binding protein n=1 Tax=Pseudolysobacter antarcticus TaxID=2511995 RepID=A0A411HPV2_9GAMM|nr:hypothetical protein [Pseudolysobacter antarcticus]QBB72492.1 hypothetical protein ELE36_20150 [Pseudolysobacter antarcticus]
MQVDIVGRIGNLQLPVTQPLIPLFECLVNSIEAIEEAKIANGQIDVYFERDTAQGIVIGTEDGALSSIRDVTIVDNGVGFDDGNFRAFFLSDSTRKANRGNKGIGRFTWLKVFTKANVDSTYLDGDVWTCRAFAFVNTTDGVESESVTLAKIKESKTAVTLTSLLSEYEKHFPKSLDTIARKMIDHLLIYFVSGSCPKIVLHDTNGQFLSLNKIFADEATERAQDIKFEIRGHQLKATILRYQSSSVKTHTISYCANKREVLNWKASKVDTNLTARFTDSEGHQFVFRTYVSGPYLDEKVNSERTNFMFLPEADLAFPEEMTREELDARVVDALRQVAQPYMAALKQEKRQAIETFVQTKAPQFRFQLLERYRERLDQIPPNLSDDQLDIEMYKTQRDIEVEHRQRASEIKAVPLESALGNSEYKSLYEQYIDEENELGKAALAKYVVHRRTILEMLESALKIQESGAYAREDFVHGLIYPMRVNSKEVEFSRQNLWVVDERLAYHTYLASDLPLAKLKIIHTEERDEPDVVVFNTPRAFTETKSPYQSVVIVEFKRPERNEYPQKDENPVDQVLRYVRKIKEGQAKDKDQCTINVGAIPFYAYILCSLTPRIRAIAESHDFVKTPDNEGYFKYHQNAGCYIEIISFDKVLNDAKKRNRAFFEHLQIPMT